MASPFGKAFMSFLTLLKSPFRSRTPLSRAVKKHRRASLTVESLEMRDVPAMISLASWAPLVPFSQAVPSPTHFIEWREGQSVSPPTFRQDLWAINLVPSATLEANPPNPLRAPSPVATPSDLDPPFPPSFASISVMEQPRGAPTPFFGSANSTFATLQAETIPPHPLFDGASPDFNGYLAQSASQGLTPPPGFLANGKQLFPDGAIPPFFPPGALPRFGEAGDGVASFPAPGSFRLLMPFFLSMFGRPLPVTVLIPLPSAPLTMPPQDSAPSFPAPPSDDVFEVPRPGTSPTSSPGFSIAQRVSEFSGLLDIPSTNVRGIERTPAPAILTWPPQRIVRLASELCPVFEPAVWAELLVPEITPVLARSVHLLGNLVTESVRCTGDISGALSQFEDWHKLAAVAALAGLLEAVRTKRQRRDSWCGKPLEIPGITGPAGLT